MKNYSSQIDKTIAILNAGGVIICPTDTIIGLSADATNSEAVNKIISIKNRPENKSFIVLVSSIGMLKNYVEDLPNFVLDFLAKQKEPTTIIYKKGLHLADNVLAENGSIGIRIVNEGIVYEIIKNLNKPIVSTSVNESGATSILKIEEISETIKNKVDFIVESPIQQHNKPSSIFMVQQKSLTQLR